jgi:hypothetical protein
MRVVSARFGAVAIGVLLAVTAATRVAAARERLAVVVVAEGDADLGDNLTEAAISSLAERGQHELVGARELRGRLAGVASASAPAPELEVCVVQPTCLARLAAAVDARRVLVGAVRRAGAGFAMRLSVVDTVTDTRDAEWSQEVRDDVASLVAAVGTGVRALFAAKLPAPPAAPRADLPNAVVPAPSSAALHLEGKPGDVHESGGARRDNSRSGYLGAAALALAVIAFSGAAVTGHTAEGPLLGSSRAEMQADLQRREDYATAANVLLVVGGALSVAAGVLFASWLRADRNEAP